MTIPSSSAGWNFLQIRTKIRSITGTPSADQLSDDQIGAYANNYLQYTMPHELKFQINNQFLDFKTTPGTNVYSFPGTYLTDSPGAYADGFPLIFYEDPDIFYQDWPQQYAVENLASGDGSTTTFTGTLQNPPIIAGTLFITDDTAVAQDQGDGTLTGTGISSGTINYTTGAYSVTFTTAPTSTVVIYAKYQGYSGNRPQGVLFFPINGVEAFTLMPVPDQVYQIRMQGFIAPIALSSDTDTPLQQEWGQCIAWGSAVDIFNDRGDMEGANNAYSNLKRYENVALSRTIQQYTPMQSVPRF